MKLTFNLENKDINISEVKNMTNEDFLKAKQIKQDLRALQDLRINVGASKELIDSWKNWANGEIDRLNKEFDEL